jgi:hypothetical protein
VNLASEIASHWEHPYYMTFGSHIYSEQDVQNSPAEPNNIDFFLSRITATRDYPELSSSS